MLLRLRYSRIVFASILSLLCLLAPRIASAQKGVTSAGTDYWITFMPNYWSPADNIRIFIASGTLNKVDVDVYGGTLPPTQHYAQSMQPNAIWTLTLPNTELAETRIPEVPQYKAIHIVSTSPIAVYGFSNVVTTTDSYLAIPTAGLGTDYYPSCFYDDTYAELGDSRPLAGEFVIVAPYDKTLVTIGPVRCDTRSDATGTVSHQKGDTWTVELQRGQTYLVQSTGLNPGDADPTGTHIVSTKPIGVLSGHQRTRIPSDGHGNSKDHIIEMMPPLSTWGTEYYDMPQGGRTACGNYIRLIAGEDGVYITENGNGIAQLNHAGDFVDRELVTDPVDYKSNGKKFMVVEHSYSQNFNGDAINSDPFSIVMTPKQQFQKKMIFRVPNNVAAGTSYDNYGTFICKKDSITRIMISVNGGPPKRITSYQFAGQGDYPWDSIYSTEPQYTGYRIKFPSQTATYVATCGTPFACYIYGFSYAESYGHPAGMALNIISPDTLPPLEVRDSACGTFNVTYYELRHMPKFSFEDTRIAEIDMITDSSDLRWPKASFNYRFDFNPSLPFTVGDSTAHFTLTVEDPSKDAYAAVWTTDKAGNDTVYEYHYYAPKLSTSSYTFAPVRVSLDSCQTVTIHNISTEGALTISSATILGHALAGHFEVSPTIKDSLLRAGDSLQLRVCYTATDTLPVGELSKDSLVVTTACVPFVYSLEGLPVTPLIVADDKDFGSVAVGDAVTDQVTVHNVGRTALILNKGWNLLNSKDFTFADDQKLPLTIPKGGKVDLTFRFHPQQTGPAVGRQDWGTDLTEPFLHQIKDTSRLTGNGLDAKLKWDRPDQGFWTECDAPDTQRVYLLNPLGTAGTGTGITVGSVVISGTDADEFSIVQEQPGYAPPWTIASGDSLWVDLKFTPNLNKGYVARTAEIRAFASSGGTEYHPVIDLAATVRHSTIRLTPTNYDFGLVQPGNTPTTNVWIHNDGDTTLTLSNLAIDQGFTLSGFTPGQRIAPGDSAMVTVTTPVVNGILLGTLTAFGPIKCTDTTQSTFNAYATSLSFQSKDNDFGDVYICQSGNGVVSTSIFGTKGAKFISARIIDTLGTSGASQYTFWNNKKEIDSLNAFVAPGGKVQFAINYIPALGAGTNAMVVYTWEDTSNGGHVTVITTSKLTGNGLHYNTTLSLKKDYGDQVYSAHVKDIVNIPIQMKTTMDPKAKVYGMSFDVRYKRDEFEAVQPKNEGGFVVSSFNRVPDPSDNNYEIATIKVTSGSPITQTDTVIHLPLVYVIAKDTTSSFRVFPPALLDQSGNTVCWVTPDTIAGTFYGLDYCGDATMRSMVRNGAPTVSIRSVTPNPAVANASVKYNVTLDGAPVTIEVYNQLGQKSLTVMEHQAHQPGTYTAEFDTSVLPSGSYVIRVASMGEVRSQRFVVQK
jgi:hypothetical protein